MWRVWWTNNQISDSTGQEPDGTECDSARPDLVERVPNASGLAVSADDLALLVHDAVSAPRSVVDLAGVRVVLHLRQLDHRTTAVSVRLEADVPGEAVVGVDLVGEDLAVESADHYVGDRRASVDAVLRRVVGLRRVPGARRCGIRLGVGDRRRRAPGFGPVRGLLVCDRVAVLVVGDVVALVLADRQVSDDLRRETGYPTEDQQPGRRRLARIDAPLPAVHADPAAARVVQAAEALGVRRAGAVPGLGDLDRIPLSVRPQDPAVVGAVLRLAGRGLAGREQNRVLE